MHILHGLANFDMMCKLGIISGIQCSSGICYWSIFIPSYYSLSKNNSTISLDFWWVDSSFLVLHPFTFWLGMACFTAFHCNYTCGHPPMKIQISLLFPEYVNGYWKHFVEVLSFGWRDFTVNKAC